MGIGKHEREGYILEAVKQLAIKYFDDKEIKDIIEVLKFMLDRCNKEGYIRVLNNQYHHNKGKDISLYKNYKVRDLLDKNKLQKILNNGEFEPIDLYYSVNTYKTKKRATEDNIKQLVNVLIDIDYKKSFHRNLSPTHFINMMEYDVFGQAIPTPSAVIFTGNNVHLIYKLKYSVNGTDKAKALMKRVQRHITQELKEFKADRAANLTTLTRFTHTQNSKNMGSVSVKIYKNISYELKELQEWLPTLPAWYEEWKNKKKNQGEKGNKKAKVTRFFNQYTLLKARIEDLEKLQELRGYKCYGYREKMCYLYRNFVIQLEADPEEAERKMLEFNNRFESPLIPRRIESKTRIVERRTYKYKTETLINLLEISEEEQKSLKNIIDSAEKAKRNNERTKEANRAKRRNKEGLTKREQEKRKTMNKVNELKEKGFKQKEIAEKLNLSIPMIKKYYAEIKKV